MGQTLGNTIQALAAGTEAAADTRAKLSTNNSQVQEVSKVKTVGDVKQKYEILLSCRPKIYVEIQATPLMIETKGKEAIITHREFRHSLSGMRIMWTFERHGNGLYWIHFSCSHPDRYPTWDELKSAKEIFIGDDVWAYQVLPPEKHYMNLHDNCFHIWHCLNHDIFMEVADGS